MKKKLYTALGLMSGTSMDGVDASLITSDGFNEFSNILDEYHEYNNNLHLELVELRNLIINPHDLDKQSKTIKEMERKLTFFHGEIVKKIKSKYKLDIDFVGFHGQTIFHKPQILISKQLGDGNLLSQITKTNVVFDFRQEDIKNSGQGAPLTPIFHELLSRVIFSKYKINSLICIINIGGISNITKVNKKNELIENNLEAFDIGPGNCLIDEWIRKNSSKRFDDNGLIGKSGKINQLILNQAIENFRINSYDQSLDIKDFDISFAKGLSLEDGCATITSFTGYLIAKGIEYAINRNLNKKNQVKCLICGGGRKNYFLIECIKNHIFNKDYVSLELIEDYGLNGDYIESQAFGYLAIRSFLNLPISFPQTTGCKVSTVGGKLVKNF